MMQGFCPFLIFARSLQCHIACGLIMIAGCALQADVSLQAIFSDNMVLQRGKSVPIWGKANPGESISVEYATITVKTAADAAGSWNVKLDLSQIPVKPEDLLISGSNRIVIRNVLPGQVWVCAGQSNMEMGVESCKNSQVEIAGADYPEIRYFSVPRVVRASPAKEYAGRWVVCSPQTAGRFSATGYFFGRELHREIKQPIGLLHISWGGTPAESWMSRNALRAFPEFDEKIRILQQRDPEALLHAPIRPDGDQNLPTSLFNGMVHPVAGYGIAGVVWYQGESNVKRAWQYQQLLPALIDDWRAAWSQEYGDMHFAESGRDFPFYIVQLAGYKSHPATPGDDDWAELREAQSIAAQQIPNCGLAVAIDLGDEKSIHPKNKQDIGRRLALLALHRTYGHENMIDSGPVFSGMTLEKQSIRLHFMNTSGGLVVRIMDSAGSSATQPVPPEQPQLPAESELKGFAICGIDRRWYWAHARIEGQSVIVWSQNVQNPVAVRYGWASNPVCNLGNGAGLPASPFRTDRFPYITRHAR